MKKSYMKRVLSLLLAVAASICFLAAPALAIPESGAGQYDLLKEILTFIDNYALYPPDDLSLDGVTADDLESDPGLFFEIVDSWLAEDPYGYFVRREDYSDMYGFLEGIYGIGVSVDARMPLGLYVVEILPGGGAESSGIEIGAQIVMVDGVDISDVYLGETSRLTQGAEGSLVEIGYINPGSAEVLYETIRRGPLIPINVAGALIEGTDVGYIRITQFADMDNAADFDYYYNDYLPEMGAGSVIIDLRGNPGGELNTVLNVMNVMLMDKGYLLLSLVSADETESYYSTGFDPYLLAALGEKIWQPDLIVVLVDGSSASASEIMAGMLQSYGLAAVVGEPTFGKAHSQYHVELSSGDYLVFTFSRVELNGIGSYEGDGIIPDQIVNQQTIPTSELDLRPFDTLSDLLKEDAPTERVLAMQERLALLGYYRAEPSGSFDDYTLWCLNRFRVAHGLAEGTYADSGTLGALAKAIDDMQFYEDSQLTYALALLGIGYDSSLWVNTFSDIKEAAWYYEGVAYVDFYGLMNGVGDEMFEPGGAMTRAMFAQVLYNTDYRAKWEGAPPPSRETVFADVPKSAWYHDAVTWAASNGIVTGFNGRFDPLRPVTRQEMAAMLYRYATEFKHLDIPLTREMPDFSDAGQISSWAAEAVRALSEAAVINGIGDGFAPQRNATRAEVAILLMNFMLLVVNG